jgi:hypothetical protein
MTCQNFSFAHFNINGRLAKKLAPLSREYHIIIQDHQPDLLILTETHSGKNLPNISGYHLFSQINGKPSLSHLTQGMAIYTKLTLPLYSLSPIFSHPDHCLQVIQINTKPDPNTIIAGYCPPDTTSDFFTVLFKLLLQYKSNTTYLIGDFNARMGTITHDSYNGKLQSNKNGIQMLPIVHHFNLHLINPINPPLITCPNGTFGGSIIDLAFAFNHSAPVSDLTTSADQTFAADHRPIFFTLQTSFESSICYPNNQYNLPRHVPLDRRDDFYASVSKYTQQAHDYLSSLPKDLNEGAVSFLMALSLNAIFWFSLIESTGLFAQTANSYSKKFDPIVAHLEDRIQLLYESILLCPDDTHNITHLQTLRKELSSHLDNRERLKLTRILQQCEQMIPSDAMHAIKNASAKSWSATPLYLYHNNQWTSANEAFTSFYNDLFNTLWDGDEKHDQEINTELEDFLDLPPPRSDPHSPDPRLNFTLTNADTLQAMFRLRRRAAPGFNGITASVLFISRHWTTTLLTKMFNHWLTYYLVPPFVLTAKIFAIIKNPEKTTSPADFRPISLLSVFYKLFEYILHKAYHDHIAREKLALPHPAQFGFRPKRSIQEPLFLLRAMSEELKLNNEPLYMLSMDVKKAFDKVWRAGILVKMIRYNFPPYLIRILEAIFQGTGGTVVLRFQSLNYFTTWVGSQQGGVLSPDIYSLLIHDLSVELQSTFPSVDFVNIPDLITHLLFADDLNLLAKTLNGLQLLLHTTKHYSWLWHFRFSPSKCKALFYNVDLLEQKLLPTPNPASICLIKDLHNAITLPHQLDTDIIIGYCGWKYTPRGTGNYINLHAHLLCPDTMETSLLWIALKQIPTQLRPNYNYQSHDMPYLFPKSFDPKWNLSLPHSGLTLDNEEIPLVFGLRYLGSGMFSHGTPSILGSAQPYVAMSRKYGPRIRTLLKQPFDHSFVLKLNFLSTFVQCYSNLYHQFLPYSLRFMNSLDKDHVWHLREILGFSDCFSIPWSSWRLITGRLFPSDCFVKARLLFHIKLCDPEHPLFHHYRYYRHQPHPIDFITETKQIFNANNLSHWWDPDDWPEPSDSPQDHPPPLANIAISEIYDTWKTSVTQHHYLKHPESGFSILKYSARRKPFFFPEKYPNSPIPSYDLLYRVLLDQMPCKWHNKNLSCNMCEFNTPHTDALPSWEGSSFSHCLAECPRFEQPRSRFLINTSSFLLDLLHQPCNSATNTHGYATWIVFSSHSNHFLSPNQWKQYFLSLILSADFFNSIPHPPIKSNRPRYDPLYLSLLRHSHDYINRIFQFDFVPADPFFSTTPFTIPPCNLHLLNTGPKQNYTDANLRCLHNHFDLITTEAPPHSIFCYTDCSFTEEKSCSGGAIIHMDNERHLLHFPLPMSSSNFGEAITLLFTLRYIRRIHPHRPIIGIIDSEFTWDLLYTNMRHSIYNTADSLRSLIGPLTQIHAIPSHTIFRHNFWADAIAGLTFPTPCPRYHDNSLPQGIPAHFYSISPLHDRGDNYVLPSYKVSPLVCHIGLFHQSNRTLSRLDNANHSSPLNDPSHIMAPFYFQLNLTNKSNALSKIQNHESNDPQSLFVLFRDSSSCVCHGDISIQCGWCVQCGS